METLTLSGIEHLEPGLLKLNLAINKTVLSDEDRRQARHKLDQLASFLRPGRPHCHAMRNLIAIFHYRLEEEDVATGILENILKEDASNLNVLQDLWVIYDIDYRKEDAKKCEVQLKSELDKLRGENSEGSLVYARCLAGKGFAWGFDIHTDSKGTSRLDNSRTFYEQALNIAGREIDIKEKNDWRYYLALVYVRQNNSQRVKEDTALYMDTFDKALECLKPNLVSEENERMSAAWCLLGNLFSQRPRNYTRIPSTIGKSELRHYWNRPESCYLHSLELDDQNCIALNQLAHLYFNEKKEVKALELLSTSLKIKSGVSNTNALHRRAEIYRLMYNKQLQRKTQKKGPTPDRELLLNAKKDLVLCIQYNPYVLDMIHMAEVYHRLAWSEESSSYESKDLKEALRWCTKAETCQDGAMRPDLHQRRGLILQDLGDNDDAIKCFMQAMDCENPGSSYNRNFIFMFNGMLKRFHNSEHKPRHLLRELVYWLDQGLKKYANTKIKLRGGYGV